MGNATCLTPDQFQPSDLPVLPSFSNESVIKLLVYCTSCLCTGWLLAEVVFPVIII